MVKGEYFTACVTYIKSILLFLYICAYFVGKVLFAYIQILQIHAVCMLCAYVWACMGCMLFLPLLWHFNSFHSSHQRTQIGYGGFLKRKKKQQAGKQTKQINAIFLHMRIRVCMRCWWCWLRLKRGREIIIIFESFIHSLINKMYALCAYVHRVWYMLYLCRRFHWLLLPLNVCLRMFYWSPKCMIHIIENARNLYYSPFHSKCVEFRLFCCSLFKTVMNYYEPRPMCANHYDVHSVRKCTTLD